jgi:hypothetical protein
MVGDKHLLIHKSCRDEILLKLEVVQQNIISGEKELIENHFNSISNLKNLERKHKSLLTSQKELNQELYKATTEYLDDDILKKM